MHFPADASFVVPQYINALPTPTAGAKTFAVNNPRTNEKLWSAASATLADVDAAIDAASKALPVWKRLTLTARRNMLLKAADAMEARAAELAEAMNLETGAADTWSRHNTDASVEMIRSTASRIWALEGRVPETDDPAVTAMVLREPYGVVLAIAPWYSPPPPSPRAS